MTSLFSGIQHISGVPNTRLAGASGVLVSAPKKKKKKRLSLSKAKSASLVAWIRTIPLGTYMLCILPCTFCAAFYTAPLSIPLLFTEFSRVMCLIWKYTVLAALIASGINWNASKKKRSERALHVIAWKCDEQ